jgi:hypothetical protein
VYQSCLVANRMTHGSQEKSVRIDRIRVRGMYIPGGYRPDGQGWLLTAPRAPSSLAPR